jgi:hypothetical protein
MEDGMDGITPVQLLIEFDGAVMMIRQYGRLEPPSLWQPVTDQIIGVIDASGDWLKPFNRAKNRIKGDSVYEVILRAWPTSGQWDRFKKMMTVALLPLDHLVDAPAFRPPSRMSKRVKEIKKHLEKENGKLVYCDKTAVIEMGIQGVIDRIKAGNDTKRANCELRFILMEYQKDKKFDLLKVADAMQEAGAM